MSDTKNTPQQSTADTQEWQQLIERYFDAATTDAEEQRLKQFLASPQSASPQYNEIKAVMGYLTTAKHHHRAHPAKKRPINSINRALKWSVAAAITIGLFLATWQINATNSDICIAYINGQKYTDEAIVLAQMHSTMQRMDNGIGRHSVEQQLGSIFHTIENYENNNQ